MTDYKAKTQRRMMQWWQSPLGQYVLRQEKAVLSSFSQYFQGEHQIQIGVNEHLLPKVLGSQCQKIMSPLADLDGHYEHLPFKTRSINALLLVHVLEFSGDPHQVLREVERVLDMDGIVIVCAFNPWSLWGLRRLFSWRKNPPWQGTFFRRSRIKDWLALLNFDLIESQALLFQPPIQNEKWFKRLDVMPQWLQRYGSLFSGATVLIAQKRTLPLTPVKPQWQTRSLFPSPRSPKLVNKEVNRTLLKEVLNEQG